MHDVHRAQNPAARGRLRLWVWNRHLLDVALASVQTGDADRATDILSGLRRTAPHWLRYQQLARDVTREILAKRPRMPSEEQRALAEFMNVEG